MAELTLLQQISIWALPILFAITAHEAAHAWVAFKLGDSTAYREGRVTLNPIKHIDLIGTVILPLLMVVISGFVFGWAKPVPVNFRQLRQPRRDMALVALAGPGANLLMAIFWVIVAKLGFFLTAEFEQAIFLVYIGSAGILINLILMILNLLPILPLDGGRVLHSALPRELAISFGRLEPFGLIILVILLVTGILENILHPLINFMSQQFFSLVGF
ncbi:MAG: site-2 protease family protein [Candidatus Parabeggiatoa sp.]|nr:site-2 protease family protein [Candidatus Parabeggiatoa sp.]